MAIGEFAGRDHDVVLAPIAAQQHALAQALQHRQVAFFQASSFGVGASPCRPACRGSRWGKAWTGGSDRLGPPFSFHCCALNSPLQGDSLNLGAARLAGRKVLAIVTGTVAASSHVRDESSLAD